MQKNENVTYGKMFFSIFLNLCLNYSHVFTIFAPNNTVVNFIDLDLLAEQKNNGGGESTTTLLIERFYRFSCRYRQKVVYLRR